MRNKAKVKIGMDDTKEASETCQFWYLTGDGFCDDEANVEMCHYDLGDCCDYENDQSLCSECLCKAPPPINVTHQPGCKFGEYSDNFDERYPSYYSDGICQLEFNNIEHFFDQGDCCLEEPICEITMIFDNGFTWRGVPDIEILNQVIECPKDVCIKSPHYCVPELLGDGICHDQNNGPFCDYDMGDCCDMNSSFEFCCGCVCHIEMIPFWNSPPKFG